MVTTTFISALVFVQTLLPSQPAGSLPEAKPPALVRADLVADPGLPFRTEVAQMSVEEVQRLKISDAAQALQASEAWLGVRIREAQGKVDQPRLDGLQATYGAATSVLMRVTEDRTPMLHARVQGATVWQTTFRDIIFPLSGGTTSAPLDFDVLHDAVTGDFVVAASRWTGPLEKFERPWPWPIAQSASVQLLSSSECFNSLLSTVPKMTLADVLRDHVTSLGSESAPQLIAHCILWSRLGSDPKPAWSLELRGVQMPDLRATFFGEGGPPEAMTESAFQQMLADPWAAALYKNHRNHSRTIILAQDSQFVQTTTTPQPDLPEAAITELRASGKLTAATIEKLKRHGVIKE